MPLRASQCFQSSLPVLVLRCNCCGKTTTRLSLELSEGLVSCPCLWSLLEVLEVVIISFGRLRHEPQLWVTCKKIRLNMRKRENDRECHLCGREVGDEVRVCGCWNRCDRLHGYDWWCWCGHGHGDWGLCHHGLLVLGHDGSHGHSQGGQIGHRWRGELTEDFHIHRW